MKKNKGFIMFVIVCAALLFLLIAMFGNRAPLESYVEDNIQSDDKSEAESKSVSMALYENESVGFSFEVPADWTRITKDGCPTWISARYASSIQIHVFDSSPELWNITRDSIAQEINALGGELVQFYWMDEWDYTVLYRLFHKSGTTAHIEITAFNQTDAVRLIFAVTEQYYDELETLIGAVIDSFSWDRFSAPSQGRGGSEPVS